MNKEVKKWIGLLQDVDQSEFLILEENLLVRRIKWFEDNLNLVSKLEGNELEKAYRLLLLKLEITEGEAPIVRKSKSVIVFHSSNFCPSLEACKTLGLDTRIICRELLERPADALIKRLNPHLRFSRNYSKIRPYSPYCEEIISFM
ncbi:MAG: hypothetical protein JSV25_07555 [Spirochaetota bacterium]|nr:MAG: hypothetical protein JSV25_07555 [Spirochaetota bacterium]